MASQLNLDDSSDDDFSDNFQLAERLRINRGNKIGHLPKRNFTDEQSSSSSSLELHNDLCRASTSRGFTSHNKKRQNGDKNVELLANPKRTCLSNRLLKSDIQSKKRSLHSKMTDIPYSPMISSRNNLFPDKTYEDHLHNLAEEHIAPLNTSKRYAKRSGLKDKRESSVQTDLSRSANNSESNYSSSLQNGFKKSDKLNKDSTEQFSWRGAENGLGESSKTARKKIVKSAANMNIYHCVDSGSDDESQSLLKSGALKGGRQGPESSPNYKKVIGRKAQKKVLDSDDDTDDSKLWSSHRIYPGLIFSSSDSEEESKSKKVDKKESPTKKLNDISSNVSAISSQEFQPSTSTFEPAIHVSKNTFINTSPLPNHSKSPRSFRSRKNNRHNISPEVTSNGFHYNRSPGSASRGRSRVNAGERYARRSGSPHPRNIQNSHTRMLRTEMPKPTKGRSLTGSHSRRTNMNLATAYPDLFDAEDSSEMEFFTANSYSDTETSAESFGGLTISTTVRDPDNAGVICEHSINVGSSEDEISVVFSTGPRNGESRMESHVIRNSDSRRAPRALGRRQRGSWRQLHGNVQEVVSLSPDPVEQVRQVEDDERFARILQAQFDAENVRNVASGPSDYPIISNVGTFTPIDHSGHSSLTAETHFPTDLFHSHISSTPSSISTEDTDSEVSLPPDINWYLHSHMWPLEPPEPPDYRGASRRYYSSRMPPSIIYQSPRPSGRGRRRRNAIESRNNLTRSLEHEFLHLRGMLSSDDSYETFLGIAELNGDVPRGLTKSEINRLPTRKYIAVSTDSSSEMPHKRAGLNKECQVCLMDYVTGDTLRILPCFHEFHTPCIDPWLKINHTCPVCRVVVDLQD